jgi:spermidine synthase
MSALGRHVLAELNGVSSERLDDPGLLERTLVSAAQNAGATVIESSFNPFAPHGVTGIVVIQESHLAIHTWPEHGYAALDVFTCGDTIDPGAIVETVAESLGATNFQSKLLGRGEAPDLPPAETAARHGAMQRSVWFTDRQDDIALSLRHAGILFAEQSAYQKVEVVHSYGYGKILLLDGEVAFTERDEFAYHEMIAHVPALHQAAPKNILTIGGGDGGACREFLKHPTVESVTVIEIDPTVTEACREHFESMAVSLDDPRVRLLHGDGQAFLDASDTLFDIIVVDSLDSAGEARFDEMLYTSIRQALSVEGCAVVQIPSPALSPERFAANARAIRPHFVSARPYLAYLPTNSTGMLSFILAETEQGRTSRNTQDLPGLRYINDGILNSAFQLPTFVESLLED